MPRRETNEYRNHPAFDPAWMAVLIGRLGAVLAMALFVAMPGAAQVTPQAVVRHYAAIVARQLRGHAWGREDDAARELRRHAARRCQRGATRLTRTPESRYN
jgi:hypothetical protein